MTFRKNFLWPLAAIAVVATLTAARMLSAPATADGRAGGGKAAGAKVVSIQVLKPQLLARKVLSSGSLLAREEVDLKTETAGRITAIRFKEGSKVRKGDLLVKLNDAELQAQLR